MVSVSGVDVKFGRILLIIGLVVGLVVLYRRYGASNSIVVDNNNIPTPTTSTTVMTVIGDALTVLLMKKIDFNAPDYAKRHHGGYLGEKSRNSIKK